MDDYRARKAYELLEKKRLANVARNAAEGRTGIIKGIQLEEKAPRASTLAETMDALRQEGKVTNLENTLKSTGSDTIGIAPEVRNKSKFFNLDKKLGAEVIDDVADVAQKETGLLKNSKGFAKFLPMLGLGAAGLGALSIANKVQAGELGDASLEAADLATDYVPGVANAKMALRPSELGNAELPEDEMIAKQKFNEAMKKRMSERLK